MACSGSARAGFLDSAASVELSDRVDQLQERGEEDEALELALECLEACSGFLGDYNARNAYEISRGAPLREKRLWEGTARVETRVVTCGPECAKEVFTLSLRLAVLYRVAGAPDRAKRFLQSVRQEAPVKLRGALLAFLASYPEALDSLQDVDVETMIAEVEAAGGRSRVAAALVPEQFHPDREARRRLDRAEDAVRFAAAIIRSRRVADARRLIRSAALSGLCAELSEAATQYEEIQPLVKEQCDEVDPCLSTGGAKADERSREEGSKDVLPLGAPELSGAGR